MDYGTRPQRITPQYGYIRTLPGALKGIQFVCGVVGLILALVAPGDGYTGHKGFFIFVTALAIVVTFILFLFSFINLQAVCIPERWLMIEMFWCGFIALLYLIASIIVATIAKSVAIYGAAAFFGFAAFVAYVVDGLNRFRLTRAGPRGRHSETHVSTTTTTVTRQEPTY